MEDGPSRDVEFDGFGELMLRRRSFDSPPLGSASRWLARVGTGIFWSVVVAIVMARAAYFHPGFADRVAELSALPRSVLSIFGV